MTTGCQIKDQSTPHYITFYVVCRLDLQICIVFWDNIINSLYRHALFCNAVYGQNTAGSHALTSAATSEGVFPEVDQNISYNAFDKVSSISEGNQMLQITYGHHRQRIGQQYTASGSTTHKVYAGACEYITTNGQTTTLTYLSGPEGLFALHVKKPNGSYSIRYIHKDHASTKLSTGLGSWHTITDENGNLLQELSFDACSVKLGFCKCSEAKPLVELIPTSFLSREGNRRNPATWRAFTGTPPEPLFDRGFTGHEHLYGFQLINMNGRMYDPVVSRMLSPDNFVQAPDFSQSFNRYSYVWNNPLIYTDPSGEFIFTALLAPIGLAPLGIIIDGACWGAVIGGGVYTASAALSPGGLSQNWNSNDFWRSVGVGAVSGAVTAGMGLIAPSFSVTSTSFTSNLPTYLGKAGWAGLTAATATGAGMLTNDLLDDGVINTHYSDYLRGMGIAGLSAGLLSFGGSVYEYATWDRFTDADKSLKIQNRFGSNVQYDPTSGNYGYYNPGSPDVYLGPAALESKRLAYITARHELKHLSDWNKYTAGNLTIPPRRGFVNHFEIRAYKHEMRYWRITSKDYLNNLSFIKANHGYKGFGTFLPNPFMFFNAIF